ncbi:MAG: hypothetical protein AB7S80_00385 [Rhizobiaceae bacterium]
MLKTAIIAMTVLGCDSEAKMCEYVSTSQPEWATMAECEEALKGRAVRDMDFSYPTIVGICRSTQESPVRLASAPLVDTTRTASTRPAEPVDLTAAKGDRSIMIRAADGYVVARNAIVGVAGGTVEFVGGAAYGTVEMVGGIARGTVNAVGAGAGWAFAKATSLF